MDGFIQTIIAIGVPENWGIFAALYNDIFTLIFGAELISKMGGIYTVTVYCFALATITIVLFKPLKRLFNWLSGEKRK